VTVTIYLENYLFVYINFLCVLCKLISKIQGQTDDELRLWAKARG